MTLADWEPLTFKQTVTNGKERTFGGYASPSSGDGRKRREYCFFFLFFFSSRTSSSVTLYIAYCICILYHRFFLIMTSTVPLHPGSNDRSRPRAVHGLCHVGVPLSSAQLAKHSGVIQKGLGRLPLESSCRAMFVRERRGRKQRLILLVITHFLTSLKAALARLAN